MQSLTLLITIYVYNNGHCYAVFRVPRCRLLNDEVLCLFLTEMPQNTKGSLKDSKTAWFR